MSERPKMSPTLQTMEEFQQNRNKVIHIYMLHLAFFDHFNKKNDGSQMAPRSD